jgi:hypothetical protein
MDFEQALRVVRHQVQATVDEYREACETLIANRDKLTYGVFICLPGGLGGNSDPAWQRVKDGSVERCRCGNERVIEPLNVREEFIAKDGGEVTISETNRVHLKPVGGDKASTYIRLWIESGSLAFMDRPFGPLMISASLFKTPCYQLDKLAEAMAKSTGQAIMRCPPNSSGKAAPMFAIKCVDAKAKTVTIILDRDVELQDPDEPNHEC